MRNQIGRFIIGIFSLCWAGYLSAQEFYVDSIRPTTINTVQAQFDAYVSGLVGLHPGTYTATISSAHERNSFQNVDFSAGLSTTIFSSKFKLLRFTCSLGYTYRRLFYNNDFFTNAGIHSHWLTSEWKVGLYSSVIGLEVGIAIDGLLKNTIVTENHFRYVGFNDDCFNKVSTRGLLGLFFPSEYCTLELVAGIEIVPPLNTKKLAYYNLSQTEYYGLTYGLRLYIPIFTTFTNNSAIKMGGNL